MLRQRQPTKLYVYTCTHLCFLTHTSGAHWIIMDRFDMYRPGQQGDPTSEEKVVCEHSQQTFAALQNKRSVLTVPGQNFNGLKLGSFVV